MPDPAREHHGRLARHLTPPRRLVLELLRDAGPMTPEQVEARWRRHEPAPSPLVLRRLGRIVADTLWRLESVGLVERGADDTVAVTADGLLALAAR